MTVLVFFAVAVVTVALAVAVFRPGMGMPYYNAEWDRYYGG